MGNITKKIISFGVALLIATTSLNAGLLSDIQNSLDTSVEVTNGGYFKTQTGGVWSAGSVRVRFDTGGTVYPFHAQAPSFSIGCNGIDIAFGAFSYLNFDYLVDKLKKIAAVAPAFAFQTAMRTLCPQCATILDNLEKIVNMINGLNFDTCKMAQGLGSKISDTLLGSGASDNFMNARAEQINNGLNSVVGALQGVQKFFNGESGKKGAENMMGYGSFLKKAMETYKNPTSLSDEQWEAFVTALIGDVYGYTNKQQSTDGKDQSQYIKFINAQPVISVDTMLKALTKGGVTIHSFAYTDNKDGDVYLMPNADPIDIIFNNTNALIPYIQNKINDMVTKIRGHESLTDEEIKFINSMPLPIYKIVNLESLQNGSMTSLVAEYMGYDLAGKYLIYYINEIRKQINALTSNPNFKNTINETAFNEWRKNVFPIIKDLNTKINTKLQEVGSQIKNKVKLLDYYQNLQKQLMQTNPIWKTGNLGM